MKYVEKVSKTINLNANNKVTNDLVEGTKFKDNFNQELTVPCLPNNIK